MTGRSTPRPAPGKGAPMHCQSDKSRYTTLPQARAYSVVHVPCTRLRPSSSPSTIDNRQSTSDKRKKKVATDPPAHSACPPACLPALIGPPGPGVGQGRDRQSHRPGAQRQQIGRPGRGPRHPASGVRRAQPPTTTRKHVQYESLPRLFACSQGGERVLAWTWRCERSPEKDRRR